MSEVEEVEEVEVILVEIESRDTRAEGDLDAYWAERILQNNVEPGYSRTIIIRARLKPEASPVALPDVMSAFRVVKRAEIIV